MKQPLGIWITDTHLSENTIEVNRSIFKQVFDICAELGLTSVFHGGDIFTSRKGQPEIVLNAFRAILDEAQQYGIKIFAIPGNHDKTNYINDTSFVDHQSHHEALNVLEVGAALHYDTVSIHFLPYYDEKLAYREKLNLVIANLVPDLPNVLLTHVGIDGVKNNGHVNVENDVKQDLFDEFDLVLVGHYHDRQILGSRQQIVYTGSPYQANFGEDAEKGCTVIYDDATYDFIPLHFEQYITLDLKPSDIDADLVRMVTEKRSEAKIRIKIDDQIADDKKGMVAQLESVGVKVEATKQDFTPLDQIGESQVLFSDTDILTGYDEWAASRGIENAEFGKEMLQQVLEKCGR